MASPFPGMDPYLEAPELWPDFQHGFMACLCDVVQRDLGDRYRLRLGTRLYTTEQALLVSVIREEHREEFLEIRQAGSGRVITVVDLVSPANRTTKTGRQHFLAKREETRRQGAHRVEIELVLQGQSCLDVETEGLPEWRYAVSICRANKPDRYELYAATLQQRLPPFPLPLASNDGDLRRDLQQIFDRCYERHFDGRVDYQKEPPTLLKDADRKWVESLLRHKKLR